jgi:hypothetical protein
MMPMWDSLPLISKGDKSQIAAIPELHHHQVSVR